MKLVRFHLEQSFEPHQGQTGSASNHIASCLLTDYNIGYRNAWWTLMLIFGFPETEDVTRCWNASSSFTKSKSISSQSIWSCQLLVFVQTEFTATLEKSLVCEKACFACWQHCCKLWSLWEYVECIKLRTKKIINVREDKAKTTLKEKMSYAQNPFMRKEILRSDT